MTDYKSLGGNPIGVELTDLFADKPGNGSGTKVMQELVRRADKEGISLYLRPSSTRNRDFYGRFGFESSDSMMVRFAPLPDWFKEQLN